MKPDGQRTVYASPQSGHFDVVHHAACDGRPDFYQFGGGPHTTYAGTIPPDELPAVIEALKAEAARENV